MNVNDLIIIYLACGSPFAVYYFFDNRKLPAASYLLFKSTLVFLFWIPFALNILLKNIKVIKSNPDKLSDSDIYEKIFPIQKELEKLLIQSRLNLSIYEFREIAERYIGLTFAKQNAENNINQEIIESEIFEINGNDNIKVSSACFARRNRKRLSFHQKNAKRDFLNIISSLSATDAADEKFSEYLHESVTFLSYQIATLLGDKEAQNAVLKMSGDFRQSNGNLIVKNTENELWKTEIHKPLPANKLSIRLQILTATANSRRKD